MHQGQLLLVWEPQELVFQVEQHLVEFGQMVLVVVQPQKQMEVLEVLQVRLNKVQVLLVVLEILVVLQMELAQVIKEI
jgi:hypothetical protein